MKLLILIYLQFLYTIGAFKGRCWIDQQILWCYKTLESKGHKVEALASGAETPRNIDSSNTLSSALNASVKSICS